MQQLIALVGLPLALLVTTTGLGLLAERAVAARLPDGLLAPLGFCVATAALLFAFEVGAGLTVAVALLVAGTVAGFALARSELRARINPGWPGLAGLAVYAIYAAPVLLTGDWTWSGYNFLNDTSVQFLLIDHLKGASADLSALPLSTGRQVTTAYLGSGYPLGTHAFAAALAGLLASGPEVIYVPFVAGMAALAAMALSVFGARTLLSAPVAAVAGAFAMSSNLTYNTGLQGSIKEIGVIAALATATALARELVAAAQPVRVAALLGLALASILSVYSAAGLPYIAALLATLALVVLLVHRREALRAGWLVAGAAAGVVSLTLAAPVIAKIVDFYRVASVVVDAAAPTGDALGQLAAPLPLLQAGGIWLDGAYQTPISPSMDADVITHVGLWIVAGLAALALLEIVRRRCPEALLVAVPAALTAALVAPGVAPYADAKLLAIMSPSILMLAVFGLTAIARVLRPAGLVVALVVAVAVGGAVAVSDVFALHDSRVAPRDRMLALREAGEWLAPRGAVLFNEAEEFAKYFAGRGEVNASTESITPLQVLLRSPTNPFGRYFDLDLQRLEYFDRFPNILMRRSPSASRPPAAYRRVFANRYYEAWSRGSGPKTIAHLPLQRRDKATATARCSDVRKVVRRARGRRGVALVAAVAAPTVSMDIIAAVRSPNLAIDQGVPGAVSTIAPGEARGKIEVARTGTYRLWVRGSFPRATRVAVDGVARATVHGANTPGQWLGDVPVRLTAGTHRVEVQVPGGSLEPGDGSIVTIGPVAFVAERAARLETVALARWRSLCGRELDWIELVER